MVQHAETTFGSGLPMCLFVYLPRGELRGDLLVRVVEALEPSWRMNIHDPHALGARVAEGVGHPSWLDHVRTSGCDAYLAAHVARQLPLQHERALVLPAVGVRGYHHAGGKAPLDDRKPAAEALSLDLVDYVQGGKGGPFARTDEDPLVLLRHEVL